MSLSDADLIEAHQRGGLRAVATMAVVDYMSTIPGEDGMYEHVVVPVNSAGQGPATGDDFDHWGCWCGDPECLVGKYGKRPEFLLARGFPNDLG